MSKRIFSVGILVAVLSGIQVVLAGPEQAFVEAMKAGKPLTAESEYMKLSRENAQVPAIIHYQAAGLAEALGKTTLRKDRLMIFLKQEKGFSPEVERALWYLAKSGAGVEYYERLAANVKPSETLRRVGSDLLNQLSGATRPTEAIRLADVLLAKFPDQGMADSIMYLLYDLTNRAGGNTPEKALAEMMMKHERIGNSDYFYHLLFSGGHQKAFQPDFAIQYLLKHGGKNIKDDRVYRQIDWLRNSTLAKTTNTVEIAARTARLETLKKAKKEIFDGRHTDSAAAYYEVAVNWYPKNFFTNVQTNGYVGGAVDLLKEVMASKRYKEDAGYRGTVNNIRNWQLQNKRITAKEIAPIVDANPSEFDVSQLYTLSSLGNVWALCDKEKGTAPIDRLAQKFPTRADEIYRNHDCYIRFLNAKGNAGDPAAVKRIAASYAKFDWGFGYHIIDWTLGSCTSMTYAAKLDLFKSMYAVTGYTGTWGEFRKRAQKAKDKDGFYGDAAVKQFAATIKDDALSNDPMIRAATLMSRAKRNSADAHKAAAEFVKAYPGKFGSAKLKRDNDLARSIAVEYWQKTSGGSADDNRKFCETILPKMSKDWQFELGWWGTSLGKAGSEKLWLDYYRNRAEIEGKYDHLANMRVAKDAEKPFETIDMKKMSAATAYDYFWGNLERNRLKDGPGKTKFYWDYLAAHPLDTNRTDIVDRTVEWCCNWSIVNEKEYNKELLAKFPLETAMKYLFAKPYPGYRAETYTRTMTLAYRMGKLPEFVKRYKAWIATLDPGDRLSRYESLLGWQIWMPKDDQHKNAWYRDMIEDEKEIFATIKDVILPGLKAVPRPLAQNGNFDSTRFWERLNGLRSKTMKLESIDEAGQKLIESCMDEIVDLVVAGAGNSESHGYETVGWHRAMDKALAAKDGPALIRLVRRTCWSDNWPYICGEQRPKDLMAALRADWPEILYVYVDTVPGDHGWQWMPTLAAKYRAEVAAQIPGIYPVGENDPAYPLWVAADMLSRKNTERAWQIVREPKNQAVLEREVMKLPPDFVIWAVEQLRMDRGENDANLLKARQIASVVISQESRTSPEVVAAMMLSRAEGYRDQRNFEVAKLEYQSIRNSDVHHRTKAGKQAMFRAVDLQIASGNTGGVEQTLEYWLSQNDREVVAQAHYFLAKVAYDRKDYEECIKQLRQVFAIDYTHTEARFLHGQWKLATGNEVDETDVLVGDLSDRSMIRPGNQLTITVQDANLSVAGGGASIPVVVTTAPGGDREYVNLYPSSRDPSNFKGVVEVRLGKPCVSNRVVDVTGGDTVSYVIDPAYLKERGLPLNVPKKLSVVDDAKLAIGAGAPRAEEKKTEKGIKELMADGQSMESGAVSSQLRPGNPLYMVVQDRDCSRGGAADKVRVTIETSSGDRVTDFELQEEKPYTGVFRGKIETSLPPPRAFASDTAAGLNAGDVINSGKTGGWKSLSDGLLGKWFAVDTMASHLFSEITLDMPDAANVKALKLVGQMGSRTLELGRLPAETEASKLFLRRQQQWHRGAPRSLDQLRAFCQTDKAGKKVIEKGVTFKAMGRDWQSAFFSGPFALTNGDDVLCFTVKPRSEKKAEALKNLWIAVAIDGEEIFSGQGLKLANATMVTEVPAGNHRFEMAVTAYSSEDDFDLLLVPSGREPTPVPEDWFDPGVHTSLSNFVKACAQLARTETGFKATFAEPTRLRSFRWEFSDVRSPSIAVTRIAAKNEKDEAILPVASDFSDAQSNRTLEVAPGDRIRVKYEDERSGNGTKRVLQRDMASSFNNASVRFIFEEPDDDGRIRDYDAFRFQPGDSLVLAVADPDCDVSDAADKVEIRITNKEGKTFRKTLTEYRPTWVGGAASDDMHTGIFMGTLRTCHEGNTNQPAKVLRVASDELLTVSYDDRENTDPGVPFTRTAKISAARRSDPALTLFKVKKHREIDRSADAKVQLERIRRRAGNENVETIYRDVVTAEPFSAAEMASTNLLPVNVAARVIPIRVNDRARARHSGSKIYVEAIAHSERARAAAENREPEKVRVALTLGGSYGPLQLSSGFESRSAVNRNGTFSGCVRLSLGAVDPSVEATGNAQDFLCVTGSDKVDITVFGEDGKPVITRTMQLVSDGTLGLTDSTFAAERDTAHIGESFFVKVDDADCDLTDEPDRITMRVKSVLTGVTRPITLSETMPHSGIFTGRLRPVMFAPGETIPSVATGGVASAKEILTEDRFAIGYGDRVEFAYADERTLPWTAPRTLTATGSVFKGSNGDVRLFSKRFADRDEAVLVQFRLAECLFEQAKEHRKLKQQDKAAACIDEGKFILEEALKNYPDSSHVVQGEYLLANLYQELATEAKDAKEMEKARPLYQEALSRFSQILGTWPEGEYAARSQYHKALCLEMLQDFDRASEEYVKMTYLYPQSELVGEATIRLATYYYKQGRFDVSGHIYRNFQQRFPQHGKAARSLFMAGSCYVKQAEFMTKEIARRREAKQPIPNGYEAKIGDFYRDAVRTFEKLVDVYRDSEPKLRAQTLYWAGDVSVRRGDYPAAYNYLKRTVFEFPETEWARRARGLLLQEDARFKDYE